MSEREKFILRAALLYAISNLDDVNEVFQSDNEDGSSFLLVNGETGNIITEDEVDTLITGLQ